MFHVKHFGTIARQKPCKAEDSGPFFDHVRSIDFFGAIPGGRRRLGGLAGLREVIPDVSFADLIEFITRDGRTDGKLVVNGEALDTLYAAAYARAVTKNG